ncbi:MAG TPA: glycosyltransferase family A protein [Bacteroidales bacterium]|nr:glycosyltransferase family A protein [Bacteroidales bacterium]
MNLSRSKRLSGIDMRFIIVSCGYNAEKYVEANMKSIQSQLYKNYVHLIVDDASTDGTWEKIKNFADDKTVAYRNIENQKWIKNALQYLPPNINSEEDVIVLVDLDDSLAHNTVLNKVEKAYRKHNCWMTYSLFRYSNGMTSNWIPRYTKEVYEKKLYRRHIWLFGHMRTFKAFLWNNLKDEDLRDENGNYCIYAYDQVILMPMLEMCPPNKIYFIDDVMYNYNDDNPLQVEKINKSLQSKTSRYIRSRPSYATLIR